MPKWHFYEINAYDEITNTSENYQTNTFTYNVSTNFTVIPTYIRGCFRIKESAHNTTLGFIQPFKFNISHTSTYTYRYSPPAVVKVFFITFEVNVYFSSSSTITATVTQRIGDVDQSRILNTSPYVFSFDYFEYFN